MSWNLTLAAKGHYESCCHLQKAACLSQTTVSTLLSSMHLLLTTRHSGHSIPKAMYVGFLAAGLYDQGNFGAVCRSAEGDACHKKATLPSLRTRSMCDTAVM